MAFLAAAAPYLAAAGTAVTVLSEAKAGADANAQAKAQAAAFVNKANADAAAAERQAIQSRREGQYLASRAQAIAAASGAGASDPTVANIIGGIKGQSEYTALTQLYEGETDAGNALSNSQAVRNEGRAAQGAGTLRGVSTVLSGASDMYWKYGGGGPKLNTKYGQ